jgi:hypothetical protein
MPAHTRNSRQGQEVEAQLAPAAEHLVQLAQLCLQLGPDTLALAGQIKSLRPHTIQTLSLGIGLQTGQTVAGTADRQLQVLALQHRHGSGVTGLGERLLRRS